MAARKAPARTGWRLPARLRIVGGSPGYRLACRDCPWQSADMDPATQMQEWRDTADHHRCDVPG